MTATAEETQSSTSGKSTGRIARVIGPVVDIEFPVDSMPEMYNLLETEFELAMGEVGLDFAATLLAPMIGTLMLLFAGEQIRRLSIPDAVPLWRIRGLLPCPPLTSSRIPI